ncbi:hypothetical protein [Thermoleptolyngbya sp.]
MFSGLWTTARERSPNCVTKHQYISNISQGFPRFPGFGGQLTLKTVAKG